MASFQTFRLVPMHDDDIRHEADEWVGLCDARERRKRQNRINQRAARRRQRINEVRKEEISHHPLGDTTVPAASVPSPQGTGVGVENARLPVYFPLTRDSELLHVISFNVTRAILSNYVMLSSIPLSTPRFCSVRRTFVLPCPKEVASWSGSGMSLNFALPASMMPTQIQQQVPHSGWVDLFPSPQLRDNLILAFEELDIDEDSFIIDLVGEAFGSLCCAGDSVDELETQSSLDGLADSSNSITENEKPTSVTANTTGPCTGDSGLVSWSDPWDINGWEVTEPFAKKWGFLLQGCRDVVAAANNWRELRGEDPLAVTV